MSNTTIEVPMSNIMIDLETMSTANNAAIISIGAVAFDNQFLGASFSRVVDLKSCINVDMDISAETIMWWMQQESAAKFAAVAQGISINQALIDFSEWLTQYTNVKIWGNGVDFDNVILSNAYKACSLPLPWKFYNNRCYRTIKSLYPGVPMKRYGTHHSAIDDAVSQAMHLIGILHEKQILVL